MKKAMILAGTILLFATTSTVDATPVPWPDNGHGYDPTWVDAGCRPGHCQADLTDEPFGHWAWVTGEEWTYEPRDANEPNNGMNGTRNDLSSWDTLTREWDDIGNGRYAGGSVAEFSTSPLVNPEPATLLLLGIGLLGLAGFRKITDR